MIMISQVFGMTASVFATENISLNNVEVLENVPVAVLPYVSDIEEFDSLKPTFILDAKGIKASAWIGIDRENISIKAVVGAEQHAGPDKKMIWDGDSIEFCFDMCGDGTRGQEKDAVGFFGKDDGKFIVALTKQGMTGICLSEQNNDVMSVDQKWFSVVRDEKSKETVYEMQLPWRFFDVDAGVYPNIGFACQINNMSDDLKTKDYVKWGSGTYGSFRPRLFNLLKLPDMGKDYSAANAEDLILWDANDFAKVFLLVAAGSSVDIKVRLGKKEESIKLKATKVSQRYVVSMRPEPSNEAKCDFEVSIISEGKILAEQKGVITTPYNTYLSLLLRLDECIAQAEEPLLIRHLKSVKSLVESEWARLELYREDAPLLALGTHGFNEKILAGLNADAGTWKPYIENKRNLIFAYVSRHDRSVQFYQFALPKNWNASKEYPLFFELHGAGSDHPLSAISSQVGGGDTKSGLFGYSSPRTYGATSGLGYYCQPFGRGNLGYRGISEIDIFEAYDDVHENFKIDLDRQYLYGFSMGGGGTWRIGTRTPDLWAAMAIMSGASRGIDSESDLGRNLATTPVFLWCGEEDSLFKFFDLMKIQLNQFVDKTVIKTTPELGHNYIPEIQEEMIKWISTHVRKRPSEFFFVADTDEHLGVWGIEMKRDLSISGLPEFSCKIDGNTVVIDSKGTDCLSVELENGLGLSGDVKVIWNGNEAYNGSAKKITLSE